MKSVLSLAMALFVAFSLNAQDQLPSISLNDLDGNEVNLSDFSENGKITVFSFWATWCSPCKKELSNIADLYEDWQDEWDVEVVAVNIDDQRNYGKVKPYVDGQSWEYTVLMDPNEQLKRALNFQTVPFTFVLDQEGNVAYQHTGYVEGDEYELEDIFDELSEK